MRYGEAKWVIHPLGIKVRLMLPDDWKEEVWDIDTYGFPVDETDYAGVEHLKLRLTELELLGQGGEDIAFYELEAIDPDWKSKHMDHLRDEFGPSTEMYLDDGISPYWFCEKDPSRMFEKDLNDYVDEKWQQYTQENEGNPKKLKIRENGDEYRQWTDEFCKINDLGRAIPMFLAQYYEDVAWIEAHLKQEQEPEEIKKPDGRGKNPNSLANLRQFRKDVVE